MPRKSHMVKASLVKSVAKTTSRIFSVVASTDNSKLNLKKLELCSYGCKTCKTEFATLKGKEPFCVVCSSTDVTPINSSKNSENLAKVEDSELASVHCNNCSTNNVITMETANLLDTKLHCVTCGTEIEYSLTDEDEDLENTDISTDDDLDTEGGEPLVEEESESEDLENTETSDLNDNEGTGSDNPEKSTNVNTPLQTTPSSLPTVEEQEIKPVQESNTELTDTGVSDGNLNVDSEEFDLLGVVEGSLSIDRYGDKIIASKNGVPVAILDKSKNTEQAGAFNSNSFIQAINHTVKRYGAMQALASFSFDLIKVKLPVPAIVESRVKSEVAASASNYESKLKDLNADFQQCLSLASVGLTKGAFKGKQNILKASLTDNLKAANLRNPEKLVSKVFSQHSDEYHRTLIETANALMSKSLEARNELAEMLGEVNHQNLGDEEFEDESTELEARLECASISKPKILSQSNTLELSSVSELINAARQIKGKLF